MELTLGFSPCPNDTFIFDALVNNKIDTEGLNFKVELQDVETLNQWAIDGKLDITKLSFPALFTSLDHYTLLTSGGALGKGVGPLLVKNEKSNIDSISECTIVLPGINTTANLLFSMVYPEATRKKFMIFSEIEDEIVNNENELGVIIHENRFTYQNKGLVKIADLGEIWEERMRVPVPLGGIAVNQSIKTTVAYKIQLFIRKSIEYALHHYPVITDYVRHHSQAMSEEVMRKHIDLYVNNYSLDLADDGKKAVETLYRVYLELNNFEANEENVLFL